MDKKVGNILKYGISVLLAAVLLYFAFREVNWTDFWSALGACKWEYVVLSMLFGLLAFFLRSLRWRELLLPIDPSTTLRTCFNAVNISYVVNMALPRVGEVLRCGYITRHSEKRTGEDGKEKRLASFDKVLGTAALERSSDIVVLVLILVVFLFFTSERFGGFFSEKIFGAASGRFNAGFALKVTVTVVLVAVLLWAVFHFASRWKPLRKLGDFFKGIGQGFLSCLKMKRAWLFFLLTAMIWCCYWMMSATILWAVQGIDQGAVSTALADIVSKTQDLNLTDAFFLMLAGSLSSIVPVPGGFGAFHFIVAGAISYVYGFPFEFGMIFATLSHESQGVNQILWGAISFIDESIRKD